MVVYRPSVVVGYGSQSTKWGWSANLNGPLGTSVGGVTGVLRVTYSDILAPLELITVDCCVNGMIIAAWKRFHLDIGTSVYNAKVFRYPISELMASGKRNYYKFNFESTIWTYGLTNSKCIYYYKIMSFFQHLLPSLVIDKMLELSGRKPRFVFAFLVRF